MLYNRSPLGYTVNIMKLKTSTSILPVMLSRVSAGFPSPADDYLEGKISFDELLIKNKPATYLMRVSGDSMVDAGVYDSDLLVVDRSIKPVHNKFVVACVESEYTLKRFCLVGGQVVLKAENKNYSNIAVGQNQEFSIFGVVTAIIRTT